MRRRTVWLPMIIGSLILAAPTCALDDDAARTPEAVKTAKKLMGEVGKAYAKAPALTDETTLKFAMPGMDEQSLKWTLRFEKKNAEVKGLVDMLDLYIVDGTMYATTSMSDETALRVELGDEAAADVTKALGADMKDICPPQLLLRLGAGTDRVSTTLGLGFVEKPVIAGHRLVEMEDGRSFHEVLIDGAGDGTVRVHIDPKTKFIMKSVASGRPEGYPEAEPLVATMTFRPKVVDRLDAPIAFDPGERELHDDLDALMAAAMGGEMGDINPKIEVGVEAPSFALFDQDGKQHRLEDYRGRIMMLDWWGVW